MIWEAISALLEKEQGEAVAQRNDDISAPSYKTLRMVCATNAFFKISHSWIRILVKKSFLASLWSINNLWANCRQAYQPYNRQLLQWRTWHSHPPRPDSFIWKPVLLVLDLLGLKNAGLNVLTRFSLRRKMLIKMTLTNLQPRRGGWSKWLTPLFIVASTISPILTNTTTT